MLWVPCFLFFFFFFYFPIVFFSSFFFFYSSSSWFFLSPAYFSISSPPPFLLLLLVPPIFFLLPFVLFFCFFFFFFVRFLLRAHLSKIVLFREPHLQRSSLVRKTNGLKSCWIVTITFLGGWCLLLWCGWQWCWWTAKAMAMMMISMELKARVARFSPKMIAKTLAGRFSHNLQHWHFKNVFFKGNTWVDKVKLKSQRGLTASSLGWRQATFNICYHYGNLWSPKSRTLFASKVSDTHVRHCILLLGR